MDWSGEDYRDVFIRFGLNYFLSVHKNHTQKRLRTGIRHKEIQKFIKKEHGIKIQSHKYRAMLQP